jgi:hypothetical protein
MSRTAPQGHRRAGAIVAGWTASSRTENAPGDQAGRRGLHVGLRALTFLALGNVFKAGEGS